MSECGEQFLGLRPEHREAYARIHRALHHLWTRNVGTEEYVKAEWRELDDAISDFAKQTAGSRTTP